MRRAETLASLATQRRFGLIGQVTPRLPAPRPSVSAKGSSARTGSLRRRDLAKLSQRILVCIGRAEQPRVLKALQVWQIPQALDPELRQERRRRGLLPEMIAGLEALLAVADVEDRTPLAWLRGWPEALRQRNLARVVERLQAIRRLGVGPDREKCIHRARYAAIAREFAILGAQHLARFDRQAAPFGNIGRVLPRWRPLLPTLVGHIRQNAGFAIPSRRLSP